MTSGLKFPLLLAIDYLCASTVPATLKGLGVAARKIGVIVIHGVDIQTGVSAGDVSQLTFSNSMWRRVAGKLGPAAANVVWREVIWSDIIRGRQQAYFNTIRDKTSADAAREFVLSALSDAAAYRKTADGAASVYEQIHARIEVAMRSLEDQIGPDGQVLILAHSLGGHIMSNYIYDLQQFRLRVAKGRFASPLQNMRTVAGLMTFGCNIPIFLFAYPPQKVVPISYPGDALPQAAQMTTWWQNFYDKQDIMAYPMGSAAPLYAQMVANRHLRDVPIHLGTPVSSGWDPLSHGSYWAGAELASPVAHYITKMLG